MNTTMNFLNSWKTSLFRFLVATVFTLLTFQSAAPSIAWAEEKSPAADLVVGAVSFVATIPYGCIKLAYAGMGAIIGGLTYLLTGANAEAAGRVWDQTMRGTYVITPSHLAGDEPVRFFGHDPASN
ncbi:MAG: hypothetical protein JSU59_05885 [Nitrospirota bacterium]|nr:MAG: hypothetical protein JSU59_05885 [Nitrospirota bacterium]